MLFLIIKIEIIKKKINIVKKKMPTTAEDILKAFMKDCEKGDNPKIFIKIREIRKKTLDIKIKDEGKSGNKLIRIHSEDEKAPTWFIHGYAIPLKNLGVEKIKKKKEIVDLLNDVNGIREKETKSFIRKLLKEFGEINNPGGKKYLFKTEHFKKQKDYFKVKRKAF